MKKGNGHSEARGILTVTHLPDSILTAEAILMPLADMIQHLCRKPFKNSKKQLKKIVLFYNK